MVESNHPPKLGEWWKLAPIQNLLWLGKLIFPNHFKLWFKKISSPPSSTSHSPLSWRGGSLKFRLCISAKSKCCCPLPLLAASGPFKFLRGLFSWARSAGHSWKKLDSFVWLAHVSSFHTSLLQRSALPTRHRFLLARWCWPLWRWFFSITKPLAN